MISEGVWLSTGWVDSGALDGDGEELPSSLSNGTSNWHPDIATISTTPRMRYLILMGTHQYA